MDICFEQREPNLAQDLIDLLLGQTSAAAKPAENAFDSFA
jgi:hypothetical protein